MRTALRRRRTLIAALLLSLAAGIATADQGYEAALPPQLGSEADLCAYAPCREVMPQARSFSLRQGRPAYVEAYREAAASRHEQPQNTASRQTDAAPAGQRATEPIGYVFLSTDILDVPGYSGQPIVTLIGMDRAGVITGAKVLRHSEPILLLGIPEARLTAFIAQYVGKAVDRKIEVGASRAAELGVDAITGATVTAIAENQVILGAARAIARQVGIITAQPRPAVAFTQPQATAGQPPSWAALLRQADVRRLTVRPQQVGQPPSPQRYIDLYFGYLNAPAIGEAVLGKDRYRRLMADLKAHEHAIFVVANGQESFKGSGFVRGGIFDRIQVMQGSDSFTFRDQDYLNLYEVHAAGAPEFRESGIFIIRSAAFSPAYPWSLVFLANRIDTASGARTFVSFEQEYWLAGEHLLGGRPAYQPPAPAWLRIWRERAAEIGLFLLVLGAAAALYASRDRLVRRATRRDKRWVSWPKYLLWAASIGFFGYHLMAQPSITQVLTWFNAILFEWRWSLFLSDPFIFLFWCFIILTVFFWGRGMFCGWLCPYGALSESVFRIAGALGLRRWQFKLPRWLHERLKWTKYLVFAGLLAVSFYSIGMAEKLAEIEPFKTTFLVGVWHRSWPFIAFWTALLALALFIERPFCKYLCPLGAALAVPSTFRWWGLERKQECSACRACAVGCDSLAIDERGRIDQRECLLCLDCMIMYYDTHACPPLAQERKRRAKAGVALTAIGADGYYLPPAPASAKPPAGTVRIGAWAWLRRELVDHLFPWNRQFLTYPLALRAAGIALAILVSWAWLLGATGRLGPGLVLGWWLAWSVYELIVRMRCKPWVKDGPWWGHDMRPASWADMAAYVSMKNLLIGAALFLLMRGSGVLDFLHDIVELQWLY